MTDSETHVEIIEEIENQQRTRGHTWKIVKQRINLDLKKYFLLSFFVDRWNKLDQTDIDQGHRESLGIKIPGGNSLELPSSRREFLGVYKIANYSGTDGMFFPVQRASGHRSKS